MIINDNSEMPIQTNTQIKLAQSYVPYQQYKALFSIEEALFRGTIFNELYQPYFKLINK